MTTTFYPGYGSKLELMQSPPLRIAQIRKFNFPGNKPSFENITNLDSPSNYEEYAKLMIDGGEMPFDGVLDPENTSLQALWTNLQTAGNAALKPFRVTFTDGSTLDFNAYVAQFAVGVETNKVIPFTASLKITGPITATWA